MISSISSILYYSFLKESKIKLTHNNEEKKEGARERKGEREGGRERGREREREREREKEGGREREREGGRQGGGNEREKTDMIEIKNVLTTLFNYVDFKFNPFFIGIFFVPNPVTD